ncbi:MAG: hypothetical protein KF749_06370 [Bacteroidetes bacterium]|nr:hypothetical protein [Bacteroidota bacterium]MCW5894588.1 hypothetical protein [Bacteroidota bacterium]
MEKTSVRLFGGTVIGLLAYASTFLDDTLRLAIGAVLALPFVVLLIASRIQLGKSFAVKPEAKGLVTSGLYSKIQHPMYVFLDLFLIAVIIAIGWPLLLLVWYVLVVVQAIQSRREEAVLATAFGAEYRTYQSQTWF